MRRRAIQPILFAIIIAMACVEPYKISDVAYQKLLVVEGFISNTPDVYSVRLSTTSRVNVKQVVPETNAMVWVLSSSNDSIPFHEVQPGVYQSATIAGVTNEKYSLHLITQNGNKYASSEEILKPVPAIDSVFAKFVDQNSRGIQILVSSTGSSSYSNYYRWQCVETYEVHTPRPSDYEWLGGNNVVARTQRVDICWHTDTIKNILTSSSKGNVQNAVLSFPLTFLSENSYALQVKYSLLVKQYSLSEAGFQYWNYLKTVNETQGSFYDIQPGAVRGNITSVSDANEPVLGYFDASGVDTLRVFFKPKQFASQGFNPSEYEAGCDGIQPELVQLDKIGAYFAYNGYDKYVITDAFGFYPDVLVAVLPKVCCDCTYLGTNVKPSFWK